MAKKEKIEMSKKEFKEEHKRLAKVLKSESHKDDKEELKKQEKEAKSYGVNLKEDENLKKAMPSKAEPAKKFGEKTEKSESKGMREENMLKKSPKKKSEKDDGTDHIELDWDAYKRNS